MLRAFHACPAVKLVFLSFMFWYVPAFAQFTDVSDLLQINNSVATTYNGNGLSFYDFNLDGWDDLTVARGSQNIRFYVNQQGTLQPAPFSIPNVDGKQVMMTIWVDYDNDGDMDLLITKQYGQVELWQNNGAFIFTNVAAEAGLLQGNFYHTGAAFSDVNNDGYLDLYVAKFYHPALNTAPQFAGAFYLNNGDGTFTDATLSSGLYLPPRTTFQPVFIDYNHDGHPDLYLVTDRVFTENALFENNGDGSFTNVTEASGAGVMICSMTGTVGDYNNDGNQDIYITNSPPVGSVLLTQNEDFTYTENAQDMGVHVTQIGWGSLWLDYDNDRWLDLFVSCTAGVAGFPGNFFFRNEAGSAFTDQSEELGVRNELVESYVAAMGDLNNDGFYDFALNNKQGYLPKLFLNNGGANHYLSVSLEGTWSNTMGVGTHIHCYTNGEKLAKYTMAGENLIGQNSNKYIFGLGSDVVVDSLVLTWRSGLIEVYENISVNQHLHLIEGMAAYQSLAIQCNEGSSVLCPGASLTLSVEGCDNVLWSNGVNADILSVFLPGSFSAICTTAEGFVIDIPSFQVLAAPMVALDVQVTDEQCFEANDGSIEISVIGDNTGLSTPVWSNGEVGWAVNGLAPGDYNYAFSDQHGCPISGGATTAPAQALTLAVQTTDVLCADATNGMAVISPEGGTPPYSLNWSETDLNELAPGNYDIQLTDANNCMFSTQFAVGSPPPIQTVLSTNYLDGFFTAQIAVVGGVPPYEIFWSNGQEGYFAVGLPAGYHEVIVKDAHDCIHVDSLGLEVPIDIDEHTGVLCRWYPNPADNYVRRSCILPVHGTEQSGGPSGSIPYKIYTSTGELCQTGGFSYSGLIDLSNLSAGSYLLEWHPPEGLKRERLIVMR